MPDIGARGLGRGGALMARADDPLAIYYNPAALTLLPNPQLLLGTHFGFLSFCADAAGTYANRDLTDHGGGDTADWEGGGDATHFDSAEAEAMGFQGAWGTGDGSDAFPFPDDPLELPEVCQDGPLGVSPHLLFGMPIGDQFGLGLGLMAPSAAGHLTWGDTDDDPSRFGTIRDPSGRSANGRIPAPTRYGLVEAFPILLFPTVSFAWAPHHMLRVGVSLQWGMAIVKFLNITRAGPGADPATDIYTELNATDLFVPSVIGSVMFTPLDNGRHLFETVLWARWTDTVRASGDLELRSEYYRRDRADETQVWSDTQLEAPQTAEIRLGLRYANRYSSRPRRRSEVERVAGRTDDNMSTERFDVELDVAYELTSMVDRFVVEITDQETRLQPGGLPLPPVLNIEHQWRDTLSVRLGGDWNFLPGLAAGRVGFSFEQGAMPDSHLVLDFPALTRFGAHVGLTVRFGKFDISLAYAHFFMVSQESSGCADVAENEDCAQGRQTVAAPPDGGDIVSAGRLTASLDMLSLGVAFNFR
ncbi:MAG: hypothetical protein IT379_28345 [Deltaproteobacteria bacterium]|nr:hypothetical protein [Deltaproteobacteria bacterium]